MTAAHHPPSKQRTIHPEPLREQDFPSLRLVRSSRLARRIAIWLVVLTLLMTAAMVLAPWQQNITGSGEVVARHPTDRRQVVPAPIYGRIVRWGEGIAENALVKQGDVILELEDLDPDLMTRLTGKVAAGRQTLDATRVSLEAKQRELDRAETVVESYAAKLAAARQYKEQTLAAADEYILMAEQKLAAEKQKLAAVKAEADQAEPDWIRKQELYKEGLTSQYQLQIAQMKFASTTAKLAEATANVEAVTNELAGKRLDRQSKERKIQSEIDADTAMLRKAESDVAKAEGEIAKTNAEIAKLEKEMFDLEKDLSRQQNQVVIAPRAGRIMRLIANQTGTYVKTGDPLFELVPVDVEPAVQIWVDGNDAPLVNVGAPVRLQFEGWPAVQMSGWPQVATGTFGGRVLLVDSTDNGMGMFRVLVEPDPNDEPWPESKYLRQGARANGWVMLRVVPLGYEVWRRMNGFPPALEPTQKDAKPAKPPIKV